MEEVKKQPTKVDYEKYLQIMKQSSWADGDMDFMNKYNFGTVVFEESGNYGLKNCIGDILVSAGYEDFLTLSDEDYKEGNLLAVMYENKWGMIRIGNENEWVMEPVYDYISFPNSITFVQKENKYGVINLTTQEFILPLELEFVSSQNGFMFCNGISTYGKDRKEGVIMDNGEFTEAIFDETGIPEMGENFQVRIGEEWGFINEEGEFTTDEDEAYYYTCD